MESVFNNPGAIVPLGAFLVAIVAIISGAVSQAHSRRIKAEQRMALLARGVPLAEIEAFVNAGRDQEERPPNSPAGRLANSRRTAMVLMSVGLGVILLGRGADLDRAGAGHPGGVRGGAGSAASIGVGFLVDYHMQRKELSRLGLMAGDDRTLA